MFSKRKFKFVVKRETKDLFDNVTKSMELSDDEVVIAVLECYKDLKQKIVNKFKQPGKLDIITVKVNKSEYHTYSKLVEEIDDENFRIILKALSEAEDEEALEEEIKKLQDEYEKELNEKIKIFEDNLLYLNMREEVKADLLGCRDFQNLREMLNFFGFKNLIPLLDELNLTRKKQEEILINLVKSYRKIGGSKNED